MNLLINVFFALVLVGQPAARATDVLESTEFRVKVRGGKFETMRLGDVLKLSSEDAFPRIHQFATWASNSKNEQVKKLVMEEGEALVKRAGCLNCRALALALARRGDEDLAQAAGTWMEKSFSGRDPLMSHPAGLTQEQRGLQFTYETAEAALWYRDSGWDDLIDLVDLKKIPRSELHRAATTWQYYREGEPGVLFHQLVDKLARRADPAQIGAMDKTRLNALVTGVTWCPKKAPDDYGVSDADEADPQKVEACREKPSACALSVTEKRGFQIKALARGDAAEASIWGSIAVRTAELNADPEARQRNEALNRHIQDNAVDVIRFIERYNAFMAKPEAGSEIAQQIFGTISKACLPLIKKTQDAEKALKARRAAYEKSKLFPDLYEYFTALYGSCFEKADYQVKHLLRMTQATLRATCSHAELDADLAREYRQPNQNTLSPPKSGSGLN